MSFEEPKAPIVRIRKKRTKRKSKDNDIVHLPVRASQQARYSSLTTPPNPQTKSRECCRQCFANFMKIPVCRLVCFRCFLPMCYNGTGSDDEEVDVKDEGYHSQNRRSSDISPCPEGGAEGGAQSQEVEMTELKTESTKLIPPPRTNVNEYRRELCKDRFDKFESDKNGEVTYIEVDSVSLSENTAVSNIPDDDGGDMVAEIFSKCKPETLEKGYEEPFHRGILEFPILESLGNGCYSESIEDNKSDDESRIYINESVLGIVCDTKDHDSKGSTNINEDRSYLNIDAPKVADAHSKQTDVVKLKPDKPHEYVNLSTSETKPEPKLETNKAKKSDTNRPSEETETKISENIAKKADKVGTSKSEKVSVTDTHSDSNVKGDHSIVNKEKEKLIEEKKKNDIQSRESYSDSESHSESEHVQGDQTKLI